MFSILTLGCPRGGFVRPPPYVFSSYPLPGGEFGQNKNDTWTKFICRHFKKKSHVISSSRFPTVITFSRCIGGGFVHPPPKTDQRGWPRGGFIEPPPSISVVYQPISMKFSHHVTYHVSFPKNIGLALYDLYDVINDVINSKNRNFQKLLQITIFDRFWWIRMEIKA